MSKLLIYACGATCIAALLLYQLTRPKVNVPILLSDEIKSRSKRVEQFFLSSRSFLEKGYAMHKDKPWGYDTADGVKVVIPHSYLDELKNNPAFTFEASINNDMMSQQTKIGMPGDYFLRAITGGLNTSLNIYAPILNRSIRERVPEQLGVHEEWNRVKIYEPLFSVVANTTARVFYGSGVVGNDRWTELANKYLNVVGETIMSLKLWHPWLRPLVFAMSAQKRIVDKSFVEVREFVRLSMAEREAHGGAAIDSPPSMFDLLTTGKNAMYANDVDGQTINQLLLITVGNSTVLSTLVQAVWDLAAHPEYLPMLRKEIEEASTDGEGFFTRPSLAAMQKLDSFIKESQRLTATTLTTFQRGSSADVTLKNGFHIPKGVKIEVATCALDRDPLIYEDPDVFDGLRFYKARQQHGHEFKHLFVSVAPTEVAFGYGRDACPGRFLGDMIIKMAIAEIITQYDLKLVPGQARPPSMEFETSVEPSPDGEIMMKTRLNEALS